MSLSKTATFGIAPSNGSQGLRHLNGYRTITIRRPRVRGLAERFESRILPLVKRRTEAVSTRLPTLYLHGLAAGDFDLALRGLLGDGAPLSAASIARLKAGWQAESDLWKTRALAELEPVYLWVDGISVKAGLEKKDKAAMLVVLAAWRDGRKVIVAVERGHRESSVRRYGRMAFLRGGADDRQVLRGAGASDPEGTSPDEGGGVPAGVP